MKSYHTLDFVSSYPEYTIKFNLLTECLGAESDTDMHK